MSSALFVDVEADFHARVPVVLCKDRNRCGGGAFSSLSTIIKALMLFYYQGDYRCSVYLNATEENTLIGAETCVLVCIRDDAEVPLMFREPQPGMEPLLLSPQRHS